jgi:hypothetical protein
MCWDDRKCLSIPVQWSHCANASHLLGLDHVGFSKKAQEESIPLTSTFKKIFKTVLRTIGFVLSPKDTAVNKKIHVLP